MKRSALFLAALLLALAPTAAAGAHETRASLRMPPGATLQGDVALQGSGLLELEGLREGEGAGAAVAFGSLAQGQLADRMRDRVYVGLCPHLCEPAVEFAPNWSNASIAAEGPGRVENVRCGARCQVALIAAPGEGTVGLEGPMDATLRPTRQERAFSSAGSIQNESTQVRYVVPPGSLEATSGQFAGATPSASGRVLLVIVDATFDVVEGGRRTTLDARWWREITQEAAGRPVTIRHHARFATLTVDGAALELAPGAPVRVAFPDGAAARLDGVLAADDASGELTVAGRRHPLDHDSVLLDGSLALRLSGTAPSLLAASALDAGLSGRTTRAAVAGASVAPRPSLSAEAGEAGGGVLTVAVLAALGRLFVGPLYHRLGPSDVLANANRRRIHEAIRARPGVDVGALVAAVGLSRVLVRHHLRMLEAHKLVRATVWRRRRTYALAGEGHGLAACELKDETRRRVACAVARSGGATQRDLVAALGLSQRLVSYHLGCLQGSGLVRAQGRNPRVYLATEALARAIDAEEASASSPRGEGRAAVPAALGKGGEEGAAATAAPA